MTQQTFPAGAEPRVVLSQVRGDVRVRVWDERSVAVVTDATPRELYEAEGALTLSGCDDDLDVRVPADTALSITGVHGDIEIEGVRRAEVTDVRGDVELEHIGDAVTLHELAADLEAVHVPTLLARGGVGGHVSLSDVARAEIESVSGDVSVERAETLVVSSVGGDLEAEQLTAALRCGSVGGDCEVEGASQTEISINTIRGSLEVDGAAYVHASSVAGDCELYNIQGDVQVVQVGGDASFGDIGGKLQVGDVGADAEMRNVRGDITVGTIGGDLVLQTPFLPDTRARLQVNGDASVVLPQNPDLVIQARVNGEVIGGSVAASAGGNQVNLTYGEGTARLELVVGGDLELRAVNSPRRSSVSSSWGEFGRDVEDFGREMGKLGQELGREMGKLGQELGREFMSLFGASERPHEPFRSPGIDRSARAVRRAERRAQRLHARAHKRIRHAQRHTEEHARHVAGERGPRVRVRFNDREWRLDPERLERIKEQARCAAAEGLSDALEAVERAISKLHVPPPPSPSRPAAPGEPAEAPRPATGPTIHLHRDAGPTDQVDQQHAAGAEPDDKPGNSTLSPDQEREAILRMVAEGRITPEEGDLLLEALDS